jgi:hypothetical protein
VFVARILTVRGVVKLRDIGVGSGALALGSCLGLSEVESPGNTASGGDASVVDGGVFPGGGKGGDAQAGGGTSPSGGSGGTSPSGGSGGTSPSGGSGGTSPSGGSGGSVGGTATLHPGLALVGDGFLANPSLCGDTVLDSYNQPSYKAIHVGRDPPCGKVATYRAYLRFDLSSVKTLAIKTAKLRFYYASKSEPTAAVSLLYIADFGQLEPSDWSIAVRDDLGPVFDPATIPGWIEVDAQASLLDAIAKGDAALAFELRYGDEGEDPGGKSRWYGVVAVENGGGLEPSLVLTW